MVEGSNSSNKLYYLQGYAFIYNSVAKAASRQMGVDPRTAARWHTIPRWLHFRGKLHKMHPLGQSERGSLWIAADCLLFEQHFLGEFGSWWSLETRGIAFLIIDI